MTTIAFIPLRGGSKSIPGKNRKPIGGKPLFAWVVEAAAGCQEIDRVIVCTDDDHIAAAVRMLGDPRVEAVGRSPETASDTATTESAMLEYAGNHDFDRMVLIQATSPLLTSEDLSQGIALLESSGADSLLSGVEQKRFLWNRKSDGVAIPQNYDPLHRPRRQDFDPFFVENGAFYICTKADLLRTECRISGKIALHVMPEETFYELDEPADWKIIEQLLLQRISDKSPAEANRPQAALGTIKLVVSDVDGVLTDSGMYYSEAGDELKKFNTRDGKGFELLRHAGIQTAIITSENTKIVERRAAKMKIDHLYQGAVDKVPAFEDLLARAGVSASETLYVGDDLADLPIFRLAGFSVCPADAIPEALLLVDYCARAKGGDGVVREVAELILKDQTFRAQDFSFHEPMKDPLQTPSQLSAG